MDKHIRTAVLLAVVVGAIAGCAPPRSDPDSAATEALGLGETIAVRLCADCHAIGEAGDSPHLSAPVFRDLSRKYPVADLEEALVEGIMVGHPDMPVFQFEPGHAEALIDYIESVQTLKDI